MAVLCMRFFVMHRYAASMTGPHFLKPQQLTMGNYIKRMYNIILFHNIKDSPQTLLSEQHPLTKEYHRTKAMYRMPSNFSKGLNTLLPLVVNSRSL